MCLHLPVGLYWEEERTGQPHPTKARHVVSFKKVLNRYEESWEASPWPSFPFLAQISVLTAVFPACAKVLRVLKLSVLAE